MNRQDVMVYIDDQIQEPVLDDTGYDLTPLVCEMIARTAKIRFGSWGSAYERLFSMTALEFAELEFNAIDNIRALVTL